MALERISQVCVLNTQNVKNVLLEHIVMEQLDLCVHCVKWEHINQILVNQVVLNVQQGNINHIQGQVLV